MMSAPQTLARRSRAWLLLASVLCFPALGNEGLVLFVSGEVTAQRGDRVVDLRRGVRVREGDTIRTGASGRTHIRMRDRTLFSLRPETEFVIEQYQYEGREVAAGIPVARAAAQPGVSGGQGVFSLLRGGFRAITGVIGKVSPETFSVRTPVATIGIRGTTFTAVCLADCSSGLVFGVSQGAISAANAAGTLLLSDNEYGYVASEVDAPQLLDAPPPQLEEDGELGGDGDTEFGDDAGSDSGGGAGVPQDSGSGVDSGPDETVTEENENPQSDQQRIVVLTTPNSFPHPGVPPIVAGNVPASAVQEENGELAGSVIVGLSAFEEGTPVLLGFTSPAADRLVSTNQGFDPVSGISWGRYADGTVRIREGSTNFDADSAAIGPHWILGPESAVDAALPREGTAEFVLVGNTDPTSDLGSRGFLGEATLNADFGTLTVDSTLSLSIDDTAWQASGSGQFGEALGPGIATNFFAGLYDEVLVDGVGGGSGQFSGLVTVEPGQVTGAALGYQLQGSESGAVSGVAIFQAINGL